jgi:hypothetical protein
MNLPGYSAEASLYKSHRRNQVAAGAITIEKPRRIVPQAVKGTGGEAPIQVCTCLPDTTGACKASKGTGGGKYRCSVIGGTSGQSRTLSGCCTPGKSPSYTIGNTGGGGGGTPAPSQCTVAKATACVAALAGLGIGCATIELGNPVSVGGCVLSFIGLLSDPSDCLDCLPS